MAKPFTVRDLQVSLQADGFSPGPADGVYGSKTSGAFCLSMLSDCRRLTQGDLIQAANLIDVTPAHIGAIVDVESAGAGYDPATHKAIIRHEAHWFQKLTGGRYDVTHPWISHRYAERAQYPQPASQAKRWVALELAVSLDPSAALMSNSFGLGQVMGFNHALAGFTDIWSFASAMAKSEGEQLFAMIRFIGSKGLAEPLRRGDWKAFAAGYNGEDFAVNKYDIRLPAAFKARGGK